MSPPLAHCTAELTHAEWLRLVDELGERAADALWTENRGPAHTFNAVVDRAEDAGYVRGIDYSADDDPVNPHPIPRTPAQPPRPPQRPGGGR